MAAAAAPPSPAALRRALKHQFGHADFRSHQLEAVQATLAGRDSLLILPTGGGKSLAFQLPPLAKGDCSFTVVVGPLLALAKDQVDACLDAGIDARVWNSETSEDVRRGIQSELVSTSPELRLLYTTPESLRNPTLRGYLKEAYDAGTLLAFAIDEAHCVSEWGCDFRPAYLELASLRAEFPATPVAALTASCTRRVEASILQLLGLRDPLLIRGGFNRPNLSYTVLYKELIGGGKQDDVLEHLVAFIKQRQGQCGLIYARLRATCDWLGGVLGNAGLDVAVYHAGKDSARRRQVQRDWSEGGLDIVVATVAFGMGIDRADVRWVVHFDVPASLEGAYQESGRAGRDGAPSESLMYVSADDLDSITKLEKGSRAGCAAAVAAFACQGGCRRKKLLAYFGQQKGGTCDASRGEQLCDWCRDPAAARRLLSSWEHQLHSKALAHTLRQQQAEAAAAAASDEDSGGGSDADDDTKEQEQQQRQQRTGGWSSARAQEAAAAPAAAGRCQAGSSSSRSGAAPAGVLQPVNVMHHHHHQQPSAHLPAAAAQAGAGSSASTATVGGVLPPAPGVVPRLRKRPLSRKQQPAAAAGGFKVPRMLPSDSGGSGGPAEAAGGSGGEQGDAVQQQQQQQQQECGPEVPAGATGSSGNGNSSRGAGGVAAAAPGANKAGGLAAVMNKSSGLLLRGSRAGKAFVPPFKR